MKVENGRGVKRKGEKCSQAMFPTFLECGSVYKAACCRLHLTTQPGSAASFRLSFRIVQEGKQETRQDVRRGRVGGERRNDDGQEVYYLQHNTDYSEWISGPGFFERRHTTLI